MQFTEDNIFKPIPINKLQNYIIVSQLPILNNYFNFDNRQHHSNLVSLTKNYILVNLIDNSPKLSHYLPIEFQLKFEVLYDQWINDCIPSKPIGIKFQFNGQFFTLFNEQRSIVLKWGRQLEKKVNQRNFHRLFKAKKKIGKGAFATVYLAQRSTDNRMFAVKAFSKQKQYASQKGKQSLINQIKIMRQLQHNNIMNLQGVFQTQNSIYVILQYMKGPQLNDYLRTNTPTQYQVSQILFSILRGLKHLSSHHIIHRDLKPQNIIFKQEHSLDLVLCDFGLATKADGQYLFVRCGTPGYVAPQIINIRDMSTKSQPISDVFSAGLIFHMLLFRRSIFQGKKYQQILAQNRECQFSFKQQRYDKISGKAKDLLMKMLNKDPRKRISAQQALKHQFFNQMQLEQNKINSQTQIPQLALSKKLSCFSTQEKQYHIVNFS